MGRGLGRALPVVALVTMGALASCVSERRSLIPAPRAAPSSVGSTVAVDAARGPDTSAWAGAADAPQRAAGDSVTAVCQVDVGCPFQPSALPACPSGVEAVPVDSVVAHPEQWLGRRVTVRGELVPSAGNVKLVESSESRWCAKYPRRVAVSGEPSKRAPAGLALWDASAPDAFSCVGDRSLLCCPFATHAGEVLASGTVRRGHPPAAFEIVLDGARLCQLSAREPSSDHCSYAGIWFPSGGEVGVPGDECSGRRCVLGKWEDFDTGCMGSVVLDPVTFPPRSARIAESQEPALRGALVFLQNNKHTEMVVVGLTGADGDALARQRVRAVYAWLLKHGVAAERLALAIAPSGEGGQVRFGLATQLPAGATRFEP